MKIGGKGDFQCASAKWDGEDNDENAKNEDDKQIFKTIPRC